MKKPKFKIKYTSVKFLIDRAIFFKKNYGYVPQLLVYCKKINTKSEFPHFVVQQYQIDPEDTKRFIGFFDRFILNVEKTKKGDIFEFHYKVFDEETNLIEVGIVRI